MKSLPIAEMKRSKQRSCESTGQESGAAGVSLVSALRERLKSRKDHIALIFLPDGENEGERLTYSDLDSRARCFAAFLQSKKLSDERVLLMLPSSIEYVVAFLGCLYARAIAVPAYPHLYGQHAQRLAQIAQDSGARAVIYLNASSENDSARKRIEELLLNRKDCELFAIDQLPELDAQKWHEQKSGPNTLAFLQYTSGSTGDPRGVMVSHQNVLANLKHIHEVWGKDEDDVFVTWLPLFHDMGIGSILQPLYAGATNVIMPPLSFLQKPMRWLHAMSRYKGTVNVSPNFAFELCLTNGDKAVLQELDLSAWKVAGNGSEPIRADTLTRFADRFEPCGFHARTHLPGYGLAEATMAVTFTSRGASWRTLNANAAALRMNRLIAAVPADKSQVLVGCGQVHPENKIIIVDPDTRKICSDGDVGEIWVSGPTVTAGYWKKPAETEEAFGARTDTGEGPFLRTGDLGSFHDGELYVTGRRKDLIIIRGTNHYPQDIEQTVSRSNVAFEEMRGAAFSVDETGEECLVVLQEVKRSHIKNLNGQDLAQAVRQSVSEQHGINPHAIFLLKPGSVHVTSSGKVQRRACKADYLNGQFEPLYAWHEDMAADGSENDVIGIAVDSTPDMITSETVQDWIRAAIARKKKIPPQKISLDEPFSSFGLDSLDIATLTGELSSWLDQELSPTLIFDYPTIRLYSERVAGKSIVQPGDDHSISNVGNSPAKDDDIAIIGMACRFPGAESVDAYWRLLETGTDAISEVPADRWPIDDYYTAAWPTPGKMNTRWGGFIKDVDKFDASFFNISPIEAEGIDPQQRLLLSVTWHALENAGISKQDLAGSNAGVFVGASSFDYRQLQLRHGAAGDAYSGMSNSLCLSANRISYFFDLNGPSWVVDTACSSSLVATHQARTSLLSGECDVAIVGGVNVILIPENSVMNAHANLLSPDGRCKAFDAGANGFVRSEGCGVVILKRHSDALRDNDRVLALIAGSAVNQGGKSNGLTAPNGLAQQAVIRKALASANVDPRSVSYVEAQGTGTNLGDSIEMGALKEVYGAVSEHTSKLWVSTAKTNVGHLEAASGIAGLIKTVLMLQQRVIPRHLHLSQLNPLISLDGTRIEIPAALQEWRMKDGSPRIAGVSAFGIGGANAHVVLRESAAEPEAVKSEQQGGPTQILTLSARSEKTLCQLALAYADFLITGGRNVSLPALCYTANIKRSHHAHRVVILAASIKEAEKKLRCFAQGEKVDGTFGGYANEPLEGEGPVLFSENGETNTEKVAQWYVRGGCVNWKSYMLESAGITADPPKPIPLPLYPFQQERYWISLVSTSPHTAAPVAKLHPLLGTRRDLPQPKDHCSPEIAHITDRSGKELT